MQQIPGYVLDDSGTLDEAAHTIKTIFGEQFLPGTTELLKDWFGMNEAAVEYKASSIMPYYAKPAKNKSAPQTDKNGNQMEMQTHFWLAMIRILRQHWTLYLADEKFQKK